MQNRYLTKNLNVQCIAWPNLIFWGTHTYVRPHLEYAMAAWSPWNQGDKEVLESVQRRAVMMVTNLKGRTYHQRLKELGMITLKERRERGLIQAYKVITVKEMVTSDYNSLIYYLDTIK